tara:strand:+ start:525 stop:950 length:426 start_codon:yes stop_codon:yes gene_type:complete
MNNHDENKKLLSLMEGMMPGMGDAYGIPDQEEEKENVTYSKTKSKGDASVTVSANASSMQELHDVLRLAGITLPKQEEPEAEVSGDEEPETAVIVHPDHDHEDGEECDTCADDSKEDPAYTTNKQTIIDRLRDTLKAKLIR